MRRGAGAPGREGVGDGAVGVVVDVDAQLLEDASGLTRARDPGGCEKDLMRLYPRREWGRLPFYFILHGRDVCNAKLPACWECFLADICPKIGVTKVGKS